MKSSSIPFLKTTLSFDEKLKRRAEAALLLRYTVFVSNRESTTSTEGAMNS
jgi:hypothetical protein